jgi:hypothetical protein
MRYGLAAVAQVKSRGHIVNDVFHRALGIGQFGRDFCSVVPIGEQAEDIDLAFGELIQQKAPRLQTRRMVNGLFG